MEMHEQIKELLGPKIREWTETNPRRVYFSIDKKDILETARVLFKQLGLRFSIASGVDTPSGFDIIYHFSDDKAGIFYSVRTKIDGKENPKIDSISPLFVGAEWIEREMWEMLGIEFTGHPNLKRLLLADDWPEGKFPLRRDGKQGKAQSGGASDVQ